MYENIFLKAQINFNKKASLKDPDLTYLSLDCLNLCSCFAVSNNTMQSGLVHLLFHTCAGVSMGQCPGRIAMPKGIGIYTSKMLANSIPQMHLFQCPLASAAVFLLSAVTVYHQTFQIFRHGGSEYYKKDILRCSTANPIICSFTLLLFTLLL